MLPRTCMQTCTRVCTRTHAHTHTHTHTIQSYLPQYYVCVQLPALYCIMFVYTAKDYKCQSVLDLGTQKKKKKKKVTVSPFLFSILSFVELKVKDRLLLVLPKKSIFTSAKSSIKKTCGIKDRKAVSPSCLGNRWSPQQAGSLPCAWPACNWERSEQYTQKATP